MDFRTDAERVEQTKLLCLKDELAGKKREHEAELMILKHQVRGKRLPEKQYRQLCDIQSTRLKQIQEIEQEIRKVKARLRELNDIESKRYHAANHQTATPEVTADRQLELLYSVSEIRDEYRQFSADPTRVSSMRRAAAEFANKLDDLLRRFRTT